LCDKLSQYVQGTDLFHKPQFPFCGVLRLGRQIAKCINRNTARRAARKKEQNLSSLPNQPTTANGGAQTNAPGISRASLRERLRKATRQIEAEIIMEALEQNRWNRRRTAEALSISYRSLMYKMKNCQLRETAAGQPAGN
jgi:DNA-binding NtrC family response regulator